MIDFSYVPTPSPVFSCVKTGNAHQVISVFPLSLPDFAASLLPPELPHAARPRTAAPASTVQASFLNFICILLIDKRIHIG